LKDKNKVDINQICKKSSPIRGISLNIKNSEQITLSAIIGSKYIKIKSINIQKKDVIKSEEYIN
jgi:hypothetical protein